MKVWRGRMRRQQRAFIANPGRDLSTGVLIAWPAANSANLPAVSSADRLWNDSLLAANSADRLWYASTSANVSSRGGAGTGAMITQATTLRRPVSTAEVLANLVQELRLLAPHFLDDALAFPFPPFKLSQRPSALIHPRITVLTRKALTITDCGIRRERTSRDAHEAPLDHQPPSEGDR
jgi:hypothetical protein